VTAVKLLPAGQPLVFRWKISLRVHYDDGTTADLTKRVLHPDYLAGEWPTVGTTLPIRYDPQRRNHIEIDTPALAASLARNQEREDAAAISEAEHQLQADHHS
jgi:hypothetical protein